MRPPGLSPKQISSLAEWGQAAGVASIHVVGSRATGKHRLDSDLDLVVRASLDQDENLTSFVHDSKEWAADLTHRTGLTVRDIWPDQATYVEGGYTWDGIRIFPPDHERSEGATKNDGR